jgi:NarL family two-component system response regulator LiaR
VVGIAASGEELLKHLVTWRPQVIVQDLLLPGGIDGIETTRRAIALEPSVRVVALTASIDEARMMAALRAGATGYIRKDAEPETLLAAIRAVARGRTFIDPFVARRVAESAAAHEELTTREREVLRHVALGLSNREIAEVLSVGEETIKTHVGHLLGKLGVENRAQAIVQALKRSLVSLDELD